MRGGRMVIENVLHTRNYHGIRGNKNSFRTEMLKGGTLMLWGTCYETALHVVLKLKNARKVSVPPSVFLSDKVIMQDLLPVFALPSPFLLLWLVLYLQHEWVCVYVPVPVCVCVTHTRPPPLGVCRQGSSEKWKFTVAYVGTWVVCDSEAASNLSLGFNCL